MEKNVAMTMVPAEDDQPALFEVKHREDAHAPLMEIDLTKIDVPGSEAFDQKELRELADNIRRNGLINKPTVMKAGNRYVGIVGRRRLAAMLLLAGLDPDVKTVQVHVRMGRYTSAADIAKLVLSENARRSANALAELDSINTLMAPPERLTVAAIAQSTGQPKSWVAKHLLLNKLTKPLLTHMRHGRLRYETAIAIAKLDRAQQKRIEAAFKEKLTEHPEAVLSTADVSTATSRGTVDLPQEMFAELPPVDGPGPATKGSWQDSSATPAARLKSSRLDLSDVLEAVQNMTAYARVQEAIDKIDLALEILEDHDARRRDAR